MSHVEVTDVELGSIGVNTELQIKLRSRTLPEIPPMLELSNWNREVGHHLACPFPDDPRIIKALIGVLQERLETAHGTA
ncbi:hypothetical protein [Streptomyces luteogriseus]|uniref:hypothetical protein n=1 Tax=Streptomyces luteogriseus TaxID=68233 RepID=UPI0037BD6246